MVEREVLHGGVAHAGSVVREGDYVLRPASPHNELVHALFRYVRAAGFEGVPEPVGIDPDGRERLVFISGDVAVPPLSFPRDLGLGRSVGRKRGRLDYLGSKARPRRLLARDLARAAGRLARPPINVVQGDAATLPLPNASVGLVIACMVFQDVDNLDGAAAEVSRVLRPRGHLCFAIVHPFSSAQDPINFHIGQPAPQFRPSRRLEAPRAKARCR